MEGKISGLFFFSVPGRKQLSLLLQSVTLDYCPDRLMSSFHGLFSFDQCTFPGRYPRSVSFLAP